MEQEAPKKLVNKNSRIFNLSVGCLAFVLLLTAVLFGFNKHLEKKNTDLTNKIDGIKESILSLQNDPEIQIYSLLEKNKRSLDILASRSKISVYINHVKNISKKYGVDIKGFNISGDTISAQALATADDVLAYEKVSGMISKYRTWEAALFELGFIDSIVGYDNMKFALNFKIK